MKFENLLNVVGNEPVFETGFLLSGNVDPFDIRKQLSRWTAAGKIYQLRRGLYCLARPYQKSIPHPFLVANRLVTGSYISLQSALAYYGLIPEAALTMTSVTTARSTAYHTPIGQYDFHHIPVNWFHNYCWTELGNTQGAFIAAPEKALLDLVYLQPDGDEENYLRSLRLQSLDQLDSEQLQQLAFKLNKPKIFRAVERISDLINEEKTGYESL